MIYVGTLKRSFDFVLSITLLIIFCPVFIISMFAIIVSSPGGVFFKQTRVGRGKRTFSLLKFRTMYVNPERGIEQTLLGDPDVTLVGYLLRRLKIDELPQLINVLKGDMSLVGPRPCLLETAETAPEWAQKRFTVAPGLTGLAQVNGNIFLRWEERWNYDILYVDTISLWLDVIIIFKTIGVVVLGEERFRSMP
jgi:undecaprenyl phosphate N,N'-diacetylbacillosamine 1-phosphate transferase